MKICSRCKQKKSISEFGKNITVKKDGLNSYCKICWKQYRLECINRNNNIVEQIKSIGCFCCDYLDVRVLEFAHIDKKGLRAIGAYYTYSVEKLIKEIEKCTVACPTHHKELDLGIILLNKK